MFLSTLWASTKFVRSELTVETLASPKHGKLIFTKVLLKLLHVPNKRETWLPCFEWIWPLNGMKMTWYSAYSLLLFLEPTVRKDTWMQTTSVTVMVIVFENSILKVTWSQLCSKSLLRNYEAHWQLHFERYPTFLYFTDMD